MRVSVWSFGFKHGALRDVDLMFDVRFLPNPHWQEELRPLTGNDAPVRDYVLDNEDTQAFLGKTEDMLSFLLPRFRKVGKSYVSIGVNTRLAKLDEGKFDAIILAAAGLKRLGLEYRVSEYLDEEKFVPAVGQGAIGVECRINDDRVNAYMGILNDPLSDLCVTAERRVNERLGGGCHVPLAVYARGEDEKIQLFGFAGMPDGSEVISVLHTGQISNPLLASEQMADKLITNGALKVIASVNERS